MTPASICWASKRVSAPARPASQHLQLMLGNFTFRLSFRRRGPGCHSQHAAGLLNMVFTNITALSIDDQWLHGQAEALVAATASRSHCGGSTTCSAASRT